MSDPNVGGMRMTHTGVNNKVVKKGGLSKQKIMIEPGVYKVRTAALNVQYHGFDDSNEAEDFEGAKHALKVKITIPEKWLDNPTPTSTLKAFFMKNYRKKFPDARLSKFSDDEIELAVKDESMFVFSKKPVDDSDIVHETFSDRQDVWAMGPADWAEMESELKTYRKAIVKALAHCHRSATDQWHEVVPVTTSKQLAPTNSYVIFTGWYKMQCVIVKPDLTIADLKQYLHEKNGARMPLECIDIGVRSGDDIRIIDDALTLEQVYLRAMAPGEPDFGTGPGTLVDVEEKKKEDEEARQAALAKAEAEIEQNRDKRGLGSGDKRYFRRHDTTSRVHAEWDNEESDLKTFSTDDQPHQKGVESDLIGPQMPMHLRTTHKPRESKYAHLTADGETTAFLTKDGEYAERPVIKESEAANPFMGKTLVLGVGKRIQDEKHKIWVASVHDPYSFRGPEDRATGGGQKDNLGLQMNGAPKGWSAPAEGQATVNSDANCVIC